VPRPLCLQGHGLEFATHTRAPRTHTNTAATVAGGAAKPEPAPLARAGAVTGSTTQLDTALSGLHLDPAAKPGAALLEGGAGGDAVAATPPAPPKPAGLPPAPAPATAPPALAGTDLRRPLTRRAAQAAAASQQASVSATPSAGSEGVEAATAAEAEAAAAPEAASSVAPEAEAGAGAGAAPLPPPPKATRAAAAAQAAPPPPPSMAPAHPPPPARLTAPPASPSPGDLAVALVYDPAMERHTPPGPHVERPARLSVLAGLLASRGLTSRCRPLVARPAADAELARMHSAAHIAAVDGGYEAALADGLGLERGDMFYSPGTSHAARLAAGSVTDAALAVMSGEARRAFAVVRPPGHHATCARAQGFCFFNNCAVAAAAARAAGAARVLIVDWDVHHGNGIADLVDASNAADVSAGVPPGLMYVSLHRGAGFYPGSGAAVEVGPPGAKGSTLNVAWPRGGMGDAEYGAAFDLVVMPAARAWGPDLVIIAAGFDAAAGDPLGGCAASPAGFAFMASRLCELAGGRVVAALEGGYNTGATAACAAAVVEVLLQSGAAGGDEGGKVARPPPGRPAKEAAPAIEAAAAAHAEFWPALRPLVGGGGGGAQAGFGTAWADYCAKAAVPRTLRPRGGGGGGGGSAAAVA